jgi:hypothetical protein
MRLDQCPIDPGASIKWDYQKPHIGAEGLVDTYIGGGVYVWGDGTVMAWADSPAITAGPPSFKGSVSAAEVADLFARFQAIVPSIPHDGSSGADLCQGQIEIQLCETCPFLKPMFFFALDA